MSPKPPLLVAVCVSMLFGLTACFPGQSTDESEADFFVSTAGRAESYGYHWTGYGWKPDSTVEISIWNEPDGPGSTSTQWKKIRDENVNSISMFGDGSGAPKFGYTPGSPLYPVRRTICGNPVNGQTVLFMAKSLTTGKIRMRQLPADLYFTFKSCP